MSLDVKGIVRNVSSTAGLRIISAAVSFAVFVVLARLWGKGTLGAFSTVLAFHTILLQAPLLGLHVPVVRDLSQHPDRTNSLLLNTLVIATLTATVLCLGMGTIGMLGYPVELRKAFWLAGLSLIPSAITGVAEVRLIARERFAVIAGMAAAEVLVRGVAWGISAYTGGGITEAAWILLGTRCAVAVAYLSMGDFRRCLHLGTRDTVVLRGLMALVPTFFGIHLVTSLLNRLDFVALSALSTMDQVGMYSAPYRFYEAAMMLPNIITVVLFPVLSRMFGANDGQFETLARQLCRACLVLGLPCSVILAAISKPLVITFFGADFAPGALVLAILAFVPPFIALDYAFAISLHASHKQSRDLRVWLGALAAYSVTLLVLVPKFGYIGAAVATALTGMVQVIARYHTVRRTANFASMRGILARPMTAALLMGVVTALLMHISLPLALTAGVATYGVALVMTRSVTAVDVQNIRNLLAPAAAAS